MKNRSRTDILATLLRTATNSDGATKMKLMYGAFISSAQLRECLQFLQEKGLLVYEQGSQVYKATEKGRNLLRVYEEMNSIIGENKSLPLISYAALLGQSPKE